MTSSRGVEKRPDKDGYHQPRRDVKSARIARLMDELEAGITAATDVFWAEIAESGAPLVEPLPNEDDGWCVTFVWRGSDADAPVVVIGDIVGWDFTQNQLQHIAGTDVYHLSARVPPKTRAIYCLSPRDSLKPLHVLDWPDGTQNWRTDPLNAQELSIPANTNAAHLQPVATYSLLETPDAERPLWDIERSGTPRGTITSTSLWSEFLGADKEIFTYLPAGYLTGKTYPLLVIFDAWEYIYAAGIQTVFDNLIEAGEISELIAILISSGDWRQRNTELPCHEPFAQFVAEEVVPWANEHWALTDVREKRVVAGASFGGLAAAFVALQRPDVFGKFLSQTGAFWYGPDDDEPEWLLRHASLKDGLSLTGYLEVGLLEDHPIGPVGFRGPSQLDANRHMRDELRSLGHKVTYVEYPGPHLQPHMPGGTIADGLRCLLGPDGNE
jgi:enterochelin esterase-like enzyme